MLAGSVGGAFLFTLLLFSAPIHASEDSAFCRTLAEINRGEVDTRGLP